MILSHEQDCIVYVWELPNIMDIHRPPILAKRDYTNGRYTTCIIFIPSMSIPQSIG